MYCEWDLGHIALYHNTKDFANCTLAQAAQQGEKESVAYCCHGTPVSSTVRRNHTKDVRDKD